MSQQSPRQWDAGRFVQTLTYFEALPVVSWFQKMFFGSTPPPPPQFQAGLIFDFEKIDRDLSQTWGSLDDVVMGGVSASTVKTHTQGALFTGEVSTDNSGGFASIRTRNFEPPLDLTKYMGIELMVKGDGQRYKFFIRDGNAWDSMAYAASFETIADQWIKVRIPFNDLIPVMRAKTVPGARELDSAQIYSMQLMLSKFEYDGVLNPQFKPGRFQLLVQTIGAY